MKTTIMDALKENRGTRLTYGNRWLSWSRGMIWAPSEPKGAWVIYKNEDSKTRILCTTEDAEMAVKYLIYKEVIK